MTILVFHGDYDRLQAALMVAVGAAAMGTSVTMYFSFWAVLALKAKRIFRGKDLLARVFTGLMPAGMLGMGTSRMNMFGAAPYIFSVIMRQKGIQTPSELIDTAQEMGVRIVVCPVSMEMMGITQEELIPGLDLGGVASFVADAAEAKVNLVF